MEWDRDDSSSPCEENSDWRFGMRLRFVSVLATIIGLAWSVQCARAGAIRTAGEEIGKGSVAMAQTTADAAGTAAGDVEDAGRTTGAVLKDGAATLGKGLVSAPSAAVHATKAAAGKVWNAVW